MCFISHKYKTFFSFLFLAVLFCSCNRDIQEFHFSGTVVGAEMCSSREFAYVIDIATPDSIGDTISITSGHYEHAVMAYRSSRLLKMDEQIYGVGYLTKDYAALNCIGIFNGHLPEMILLSVDEEPTE